MQRGVRVVEEWKGFCPSCEGDGRLVLIERGPRWTARELFSRTWTPRQDFEVHCRSCGTALPVPLAELIAAATSKASKASKASKTPKTPKTPVPAGVTRLRPRLASGAVPPPRPAADDAEDRVAH